MPEPLLAVHNLAVRYGDPVGIADVPLELALELALEVADYACVPQTGGTVLQGNAADLGDDRDVQRIYLGLETPA